MPDQRQVPFGAMCKTATFQLQRSAICAVLRKQEFGVFRQHRTRVGRVGHGGIGTIDEMRELMEIEKGSGLRVLEVCE